MLFTPEMSGLLDRDRARASRSIVPEAGRPGAGGGARCGGAGRDLGGARLAGGGARGRTLGQPRARRSMPRARSPPATTRSTCSTSILATGESWRESNAYAAGDEVVTVETPAGQAGPDDLLRHPVSRAFRGAWPSKSAISSQSRPRSPCPPARRTGTCCSAPARSRRAPMSSPRRRSAGTRTGAAPMAIAWWSIHGARCCSTWAGRAARSAFAEIDPARTGGSPRATAQPCQSPRNSPDKGRHDRISISNAAPAATASRAGSARRTICAPAGARAGDLPRVRFGRMSSRRRWRPICRARATSARSFRPRHPRLPPHRAAMSAQADGQKRCRPKRSR